VIDPVEAAPKLAAEFQSWKPAIVKLFLLDQYDDGRARPPKKLAAMYAMFGDLSRSGKPTVARPKDDEQLLAV